MPSSDCTPDRPGTVPRVAAAENLFPVVLEAADSLRVPGSSGLPLLGSSGPPLVRGEPWELPVVAETRAFVSNNAAVFDRIDEWLQVQPQALQTAREDACQAAVDLPDGEAEPQPQEPAQPPPALRTSQPGERHRL